MTGTFSLRNSALLYPNAGFDLDEDHFAVILEDQEVGTIYRIGEEWLWSINIGMMGMGAGAPDREEKPVKRFAPNGTPRWLASARCTSNALWRWRGESLNRQATSSPARAMI